MVKIIMHGCSGHMGQVITGLVKEDPDAEIVAGNPQAAFDRLIALIAGNVGGEKTKVRDRLLELFALFDAADPRVLTARTKLASSLY